MHLRFADRADEPFLREALYHAIHVPPGVEPPARKIVEQPDLARYVAGWGRVGDLGVVAEIDGTPIGAIWLRLWTDDAPGYGFVDVETPELSMAVLPGHRGQGLGTALLDRLLAEADGRYPAVSLSVAVDNPARRLYERFGFRPAREPLGRSITSGSMIMVLHFDPAPGRHD